MTVTSNISAAPAWQASHAYSSLTGGTGLNSLTIVSHDSPARAYQLVTTGTSGATGPTGTGSSITDGTCIWEYLHDIDFSTLALWEASLPGTLADAYVGLCWADAEFVSTSTLLSLSGHTTSATNTITLTAATGQSFRDNLNAQTNRPVYDKANGVAIRTTGGYQATISVSDSNVSISGLQVSAQGGGGIVTVQQSNGLNFLLENFICDGGFNNIIFINQSAVVRNGVAITRRSGAGNGITLQSGGSAYFVTIVRPSDLTAAGEAFAINYTGTRIVENCLVYGFSSTWVGTSSPTFTTNQTDIASPPTGWTTETFASQFQNTLAATLDLRLKTGAPAIGAGTADATNGAFDIVGTARPQGTSWDVGAWELIASGTTVTVDFPAPLEWLNSVRSDSPIPGEFSASVLRDTLTPAESGARLLRDSQIPAEWLATLRRDSTVPTESGASILRDASIPIEALADVASNSVTALEITVSVGRDSGVPIEFSGAVAFIADSLVPLEWQSGVRVDTLVPVETVTKVLRDHGLLTESLAGLARDGMVPIEISGTVRRDVAVPVESAAGVLQDQRAPIETGAGVVADARVPIASDALVQHDATVPLEWLGQANSVVTNIGIPIEWIALLFGVHIVNETLTSPGVTNETLTSAGVAGETLE